MDILKENGKGNLHGIEADLEFEYETECMARAIFDSISVDNYEYVHCTLDGSKIMCHAHSQKPSKLLHTLDDLVACIIVAEEAYRRV